MTRQPTTRPQEAPAPSQRGTELVVSYQTADERLATIMPRGEPSWIISQRWITTDTTLDLEAMR